MTATPMQVLTRPFATEPVTNIMLPDGIFDNAIYNLRITCHYTNTSNRPLTNVGLYLESVGDLGIVAVARTFVFPVVPAGASVLVSWDANFQKATPGKRLVSFVALADGHESHRSILQIFVSETRFHSASNSYTCTVEEGTLTIAKISAIAPKIQGWGPSGGRDCECPPDYGPWIPTGLTMAWQPHPGYAGVHGDLPFSDPWWKILALIIAIIAALVAIIASAIGSGTVTFAAKGTWDLTDHLSVNCCSPDIKYLGGGVSVAAVASVIAYGALCSALSDAADPFWRGQQATPPAQGELTVSEHIVAKWTFTEAPNAGVAYPVDVSWNYKRFTTGRTYDYSLKETQTNTHVSTGVEVTTPDRVKAFDPLWVQAKFSKSGGDVFSGTELYAFALFQAPQGLFFVVPMMDDGLSFDGAANDGIYAGRLDLQGAYRMLVENKQNLHGVWRVFVFAQDVNNTKPGTAPEIAAQNIGGFFVASAIKLTFDPSLPCPLKADSTITVI